MAVTNKLRVEVGNNGRGGGKGIILKNIISAKIYLVQKKNIISAKIYLVQKKIL